jgi:hypothetical protein
MATKRTHEENLALAKARVGTKPKKSAVEPAKQMNLELWPDAVRGVPNAVLRGALFGVSSARKMYEVRTPIASVEGIEVRFKGQTFNQTDLDVWEMLLHLARLQPLGDRVEFTASGLLRALGRGVGKSQHEQLKEDIMRLATGGVEVSWLAEKKTFGGTLVSNFYRDDDTQRYVVDFNPKLLQLYGGGYTMVDWSSRQALGRNNLAKWLQGFYSTHAKPYPLKVATLHKLCGSSEVLKNFKIKLKVALDELVRVCGIKSWEIQPGDLVAVQVVASKSQLKHLAKSKVIHKKG